MGKLKVLFLTNYYPPQQYPRSIQISHLLKSLSREFSIDVVTFNLEKNTDYSLLNFTSLDNVHYAEKSSMTRFIEKSRGDRIKKSILPDLHYAWHFDLYEKSASIIKKYGIDRVVTFGQPMSTHITGLKLKKKYPALQWIAHFSDPWVDNIYNDYNIWTLWINKYYQGEVFKKADKLIFTSEETIDLVMASHPELIRLKAVCLPHLFNTDLYRDADNQTQPRDLLNIRYLGNFYGKRQPNALFEALQSMQKSDLEQIRIELIGAKGMDLDNTIKKYQLEEIVKTKNSVPYLEALQLMRKSDLLLNIDADMALSPFLSSKLIDYIGANRPIFGISPPGASQKLIEEMGFLVASPSKPTEISEKLTQMIRSIRNKSFSEIPKDIRKRYTMDVVGKQMADVLKNLSSH